MAAAGGVSASGVAGAWTVVTVAATAAVAEVARWRGDGVHGVGGRQTGGTVVRTWVGPAGRMREGGRDCREYMIYINTVFKQIRDAVDFGYIP